MHKEDLKRVAPLWLKFSKAVRHDPDVRFHGPDFCSTNLPPCYHPYMVRNCFHATDIAWKQGPCKDQYPLVLASWIQPDILPAHSDSRASTQCENRCRVQLPVPKTGSWCSEGIVCLMHRHGT